MSDVELRILKLLKQKKEEVGRGFWQELERYSDIPSSRWRAAYQFRQRVTFEMLDVVCKRYPHFALWIATGRVQPDNNHHSPEGLSSTPYPQKVPSSWH